MATYVHNVLVGFDQFCAVVFFNQPDVTVSSLCWLARSYPLVIVQRRMRLNIIQYKLLQLIGAGLEKKWPGHCVAAREADMGRGVRVGALLA